MYPIFKLLLYSRKAQLLCAVIACTLMALAVLNTVNKWPWKSLSSRSTTVQADSVAEQMIYETESTSRKFPTPGGFLVALRYYEQQTSAMNNLLQFQCFANSYSMNVLEPFLHESMFTTQISAVTEGEKFLRFRDLFDIDYWNELTIYPKLASWSDFLKDAPKQLIVYCVRYRNPTNLNKQAPSHHSYKTGCDKGCFRNLNITVQALAANYGFKLVRTACANFVNFAAVVTAESFMQNALGNYKPNQVTILMNEFRGFFGLYRLPVLSNCGIQHHNTHAVPPTKQIQEDAENYVKQFRSSIAIMVRVELLHLNYNITLCTEKLARTLRDLSPNHNVDKPFLAMDIGKFGSSSVAALSLQPSGKLVFEAVYKNTWSFKEWEKSFEDFASSNNSAYVANLQRTIATKVDCLIMVGGGSFQQQARLSYLRNHPDASSHCLKTICTS